MLSINGNPKTCNVSLMKVSEQYSIIMLFIIKYKVALTFES